VRDLRAVTGAAVSTATAGLVRSTSYAATDLVHGDGAHHGVLVRVLELLDLLLLDGDQLRNAVLEGGLATRGSQQHGLWCTRVSA